MRGGPFDTQAFTKYDGVRMKKRTIGLLAVGLLTAIVVSVVLHLMQAGKSPVSGFVAADQRSLFPSLRQDRQEIRLIRIEGPGGPVSIERGRKGWKLLERDGYPIRDGAVQELLDGLGALRATYVSAEKDPPYESYGLADPKRDAGASPRVTVISAQGTSLASAAIGHTFSAPGGTRLSKVFVRRNGEARVWLADGKVRVEGSPLEWLPQSIVDVPRRQVSEMTTTGANGERITIRREADAAFELADGAPDQHDRAAVDAMASALEGLRFQEVRAAGKVEAVGKPSGRASITTDDGLIYRVRLVEESEDVWAIFSADVRQPPAGRAGERARSFNARHAQWAYKLQGYVVDYLRTGPDDLGR